MNATMLDLTLFSVFSVLRLQQDTVSRIIPMVDPFVLNATMLDLTLFSYTMLDLTLFSYSQW